MKEDTSGEMKTENSLPPHHLQHTVFVCQLREEGKGDAPYKISTSIPGLSDVKSINIIFEMMKRK